MSMDKQAEDQLDIAFHLCQRLIYEYNSNPCLHSVAPFVSVIAHWVKAEIKRRELAAQEKPENSTDDAE